MKSRLDKYNNNNSNAQNISRMSRNKHLYDELNNKIGFEELVNFDTQTRIELTSLDDTKKNRERYHQLKDYKNFILEDNQEQNGPIEIEQEKNFDINSILEEARKNRTDIDELEKKRKLKGDDYSILSELNKKYLYKEKDEYEGLEELINTITSKTLANELEQKEENELLSDLVATSIELQVQIPEKYEKNEYDDTNKDIENTKEDVDDSFYTKSMDLSEYDFEGFEYNGKSSKKTIIIITIVIILLIIISIVMFFVLKKLQIL